MPKKRIRGALKLVGVLGLATCGGEPPTDPGPPVPSGLALVSGNSQTGIAGAALADRLFVVVTSAQGQGVPAVRVQWAVTAGGGALSSGATDTDGQGRASVVWTVGRVAGAAQTVTASVAGLSGSPVSFSATAIPGPPAKLAASAGDSQVATVNTLLPINPAVLVRDINDNPVPNAAVTFAVASGGGSITGSSATTSAAGVATVGSWKLGTTAGANTLTANVGTVAPRTLFARGTADLPKSVVIGAGNSQSAVAGQTVTVAPAVLVRDSFANAVPGVAVSFAVATGGGSVTGGAATTDSAGTARVTSWRLGTTAGVNTLTATVSGVTPATFTAQGLAGSPALLTASAGDAQSATVGTAVATAPAARVADSNNNPIFGVSVTFAVGMGGGTATGTTAATDSSGIARVGSWILGTASGANTLTATVAGLSVLTLTATATPDVPASAGVNAGDGQSATVNTSVPTAPSVLVKDQYLNPVPGVSVSFTVASGAGSVTGASATTNAAGVAAAGGWQLGVTSGINTLTGTVAGLPAVTFTATGTADVPFTVDAEAGNGQSATVGSAVAMAPSVIVRDQYRNPVPAASVTFEIVGGGGILVGGAATTNALGVAAVTSWTLGPIIGPNTLTATVGLLTPITFTATGSVAPATSVTVSAGNNQSAVAGSAVTVPPSVVVRDAFGNPVPGVSVTFSIAAGGGSVATANATTDAVGVASAGSWTLGAVAGANALTAMAAGLSLATFTATGVPGAAASVALSAGGAQSAVAGTAVAVVPAVAVRDANGNGVAGVAVTFAVTAGGGSVGGGSATTGADGIARAASWTLGTAAGVNTLTGTATGSGLTGNPVTFTATGTAGAPATLSVSAGGAQTAVAGSSVATPPAVLVGDANANPVPNVSVTFSVTGGGGSVSGGAATTSAAGIAAVSSWTLGTAAGANSLSATVSGLTPVSFTATGTAGAAASVSISAGNNQSATVGTAVAVRPAVTVRDANNNPVAGLSVTFAVTGGNGSLTGDSPTTDAAGVARVGSWTLGTAAGANALSATVTGLSAAAFSATGLVGAPASMAVSAGDGQNATAGSAVSAAPAVRIADQYNNPVSGVSVTFVVAGGGGSVAGANATSGSTGIATAGSWTLGPLVGTNTLTAAASGLPDVAFTATGLVGPAASVAISAGDNQAATGGTAVPVAPAVVIRDANGNPVPSVTVTFAIEMGSGTITAPAAVATASNGIATLGGWTLGNQPGENKLSASAAGVAAGVTFNAIAVAGPPSAVIVDAGNGQSAAVGTAVTVKPRVRVVDGLNNPLLGVAVTFAVTSGGGSVTLATPVTDAAGYAEVGSWTLGTAAAANTLTASAVQLSPAVFSATGTVGAPASLAVSAGNNQSAVAGAVVAVDPAVVVRDQFGNVVSGVSVSFAVASGGGVVTGSPVSTDASGIARLASWTLGTAVGTNTLSVTAASLTPVTFTSTAIPGSPATVVVGAGNNQSAVAGSAVAAAPAVIVRDANSNVVPGVSVVFTVGAGGGSVTGGTAVTDGSGVATVGSWTLGTGAGTNELLATVGVLAPATFSATGLAGAAASLAILSGNNQTAVAGSAVASAPTVLVLDANSNPVGGASVGWAVSAGGGGVSASSSTTNAAGQASVGWTLGTAAGANTLTASLASLPDVSFAAAGTAGAPAVVVVSGGDAQSATVGTPVGVAPSVLVRDANSNPVPGISVTFAVSGGGGSLTGASTTTSASGVAAAGGWTLGTVVGANTLSAAVSGLAPVTFNATGTVGAPATVGIGAGDNQTAVVNTAVTTAPSVVVRDAFGNVVPEVVVTFAVQSGGGALTAAVDTTDASGAAAVGAWQLGTVAGTNTMSASVSTGPSVLFTAAATPGPPASVAIAAGDNQVEISGDAVEIRPAVVVRDQFLNPVPGIPVSFRIAIGGGQLTGSEQLTGGTGIAAVGSWTLGQVGQNRLNAITSLLPVVLVRATAVQGGVHSCTLDGTGAAWCWGRNRGGGLGDGTFTDRLTPVAVTGGLTFTTLSAGGEHTCGLRATGAVWCWGSAYYGQVGDGLLRGGTSVPVAVAGGLSFTRVSAGVFHTCGLTTLGQAWCWGRDLNGQLGDSTPRNKFVPSPVAGGFTFTDVSAGAYHSCGVIASGAAYCWGGNQYGQLGTGGVNAADSTPTPVLGGVSFVDVSAGGAHSCGVSTAGTAWCWGNNFHGQLGTGNNSPSFSAVEVQGGRTYVSIKAGFQSTCALASDGAIYCWGRNDFGQVGDGTGVARNVPTQVATTATFTEIRKGSFHGCGVTSAVVTLCWGENTFGQLGDGTNVSRLAPIQSFPPPGP